jgi:hypothetical protein
MSSSSAPAPLRLKEKAVKKEQMSILGCRKAPILSSVLPSQPPSLLKKWWEVELEM